MEIIGIDAGATWIKAASFSDGLKVIKKIRIKSGAAQSKDAYFNSISQAANELVVGAGHNVAIGLSLPATMSKDKKTIKYTANIKGLGSGDRSITLADALDSKIPTNKIVADNDAACAALAEWSFGLGQGDLGQSLLHLTWGTGLGTGFIQNGKSQHGWEGGHLPLSWNETAPNPCHCGSAIDLEARAAVPYLVKLAQQYFSSQKYSTSLTKADFDDPLKTPIALADGAEQGDELARAVVVEALRWIARGLHAMAVLVYPDIITIGGGMMDRDWLRDELRRQTFEQTAGHLAGSLPPDIIHRAKLGNEAGTLGAAILAKKEYSKKIPPRNFD